MRRGSRTKISARSLNPNEFLRVNRIEVLGRLESDGLFGVQITVEIDISQWPFPGAVEHVSPVPRYPCNAIGVLRRFFKKPEMQKECANCP